MLYILPGKSVRPRTTSYVSSPVLLPSGVHTKEPLFFFKVVITEWWAQNNETVVAVNCFVNYTLKLNSKLFELQKLYFFASEKQIILEIVVVVALPLFSWAAVGWSWKLWSMHNMTVPYTFSSFSAPQSCVSGIMWEMDCGPKCTWGQWREGGYPSKQIPTFISV